MTRYGGKGLTRPGKSVTLAGVRKGAPKSNVWTDVTGRRIPFYASPFYRWLSGRRLRSCVYALLVSPGQGPGYMKIGITENLPKRLDSLQVGCPFPIGLIALIDAGYYSATAWNLEEAFHKRFEARRTSGEWFMFDFDSEVDKAEFNQGSREVLRDYFGENHPWWIKMTWAELRRTMKRVNAEHSACTELPRVMGDPGI